MKKNNDNNELLPITNNNTDITRSKPLIYSKHFVSINNDGNYQTIYEENKLHDINESIGEINSDLKILLRRKNNVDDAKKYIHQQSKKALIIASINAIVFGLFPLSFQLLSGGVVDLKFIVEFVITNFIVQTSSFSIIYLRTIKPEKRKIKSIDMDDLINQIETKLDEKRKLEKEREETIKKNQNKDRYFDPSPLRGIVEAQIRGNNEDISYLSAENDPFKNIEDYYGTGITKTKRKKQKN